MPRRGEVGDTMPYEGEEPPLAERREEPGAELDALARAVIGAAIEVHRRLGPGLDEALYQNALAIEFDLRQIPFAREVIVQVEYKGRPIGTKRLDFVVGERLIVETKAIELLLPLHKAQLLT